MNSDLSVCGNDEVRLRQRTQLIGTERYIFLRLGTRSCKIEGGDEAVIFLLNALSAGGRVSKIIDRCVKGFPGAGARFHSIISELHRRGFLERPLLTDTCDARDVGRFESFLHYLSEFETPSTSRYDLLAQLRQKTVVVVGTGGQGSWLVYHLLCMGIGRLRLVDGDMVSVSNLSRSILYTEDMVGVLKVDAAVRSIKRFAPRTHVEAHAVMVDGVETLRPILCGADVAVGVADQPPRKIRHWIGEACHLENTPSIQASGFRVGPFVTPGRTACVGCDWCHQLDRNPSLETLLAFQEKLPSGSSGALSPVGSITAGVVAMELLRYFVGSVPLTRNAVWEMDGANISRLQSVNPHEKCSICNLVSRV